MPQTPFRANSSYFRERGPRGDAAGFLDLELETVERV